MPSLTTVLPQTPLQATAVAWREQGMGKPVRAARGGISGRGECDGGGARKEHSALNAPNSRSTSLAPATWARLGAEAGEGVQARLTAHRQGGDLTGRDVVSHVTLAHEGANPQLLWDLLRPPQAGARQEEQALSGLRPTPRSLLLQPLMALSSPLEPAGDLPPPGGHPDYRVSVH